MTEEHYNTELTNIKDRQKEQLEELIKEHNLERNKWHRRYAVETAVVQIKKGDVIESKHKIIKVEKIAWDLDFTRRFLPTINYRGESLTMKGKPRKISKDGDIYYTHIIKVNGKRIEC